VRTKLAAGALVLLGLLAGPLTPQADAAGVITHSWMALEAIPLVEHADLRALLNAHRADVEAGAHFPDSGYAAGVVGVEDDYGEEAHWPRFHNRLARQIANTCDLDAPDALCQRRIAHLMGAVAHGLGDEVWDWLFEPNGPDRGESYVPPALANQFSTSGLEMQMDLVAIGDYDRRTSPAIPNWPAPARVVQAFHGVGQPATTDDLQLGYTAISVARNAEANLARQYRANIVRHMPWTSAHVYTAPGGVRFAAVAIAAAMDDLWERMRDESHTTEVSITYPADGQTGVPATGWDRESFQAGSAPDRGGALNRITAVLDASLPYAPTRGAGDIDEQLPAGAMTLTEVGGDPVALRASYPRQVPYGAESGEHVIDLQPDGNLDECTEYRVDVTSELLDEDGAPVEPYSWTFTTDGDACPGPAHRPDLAARRGSTGALVGDDVHGAGGAGQTRLLRTAAGAAATFSLRLQNGGSEPDRLRVQGERTVPNFTVQYFEGNTNVTGRVVAGTYRTPVLAPGGVRTLRLVVTVARQAPAGAAVTRLVTARSVGDTTQVDAVKLTVRRTAAARRRAEATAAPLTDAELAEAARFAQVCVLG